MSEVPKESGVMIYPKSDLEKEREESLHKITFDSFRKPRHWRLAEDKTMVPCGLIEASEAWEKTRSIRHTHVDGGKHRYRVSTIWLFTDHGFSAVPGPGVFFETMVFNDAGNDPNDGFQYRYCTYAEAVRGHKRICGT